MNGILDRVARSSSAGPYSQFKPTSQQEFFSLRLAQKLGDASSAQHYAELAEHYSEVPLLTAYRRAKRSGSHLDPARSFHVELERLGDRNGNGQEHRRLAAIRLERRAVAVVILAGDHLEYPPLVRQLPATNDRAVTSLATFLNWILERCPFETAALEVVHNTNKVQRTTLFQMAHHTLIAQAVSIWEVPQREILSAFGHPALRFRYQVREVVANIWPGVNGSFGGPLIHDALALGLYCHVEYLFNL
jgi:hypothetical protein